MTTRSHCSLLALLSLGMLSAMLALPVEATAQQPWPAAGPAAAPQGARAPAPVMGEEDSLSPRQIQAAPAAQQGGGAKQGGATQPRRERTPATPARAASGRPSGQTIACNGVFGRDSNHLRLAMAFEARNITFTQVDGPEGSKLNASVVYPNDPKRRVEVLWENEAARSGTSLIVIGGQSQWQAPKGLRIGMALAALEKANGKPFKLAGLDQPNAGSVLDWNGGAMDSLPGGCKVGVRLSADSKAGEAARAAAGGKELLSNDAALKAAKLGIVEIILGY